MLIQKHRNKYLLLFLMFLSFIYSDSSTIKNQYYKNIAVVVNLTDTVHVDNSCIRLSDPTIECETNNLNINNYHEFIIKNDTLILKNEYKDKIKRSVYKITKYFNFNKNIDIYYPEDIADSLFDYMNEDYFQRSINQYKTDKRSIEHILLNFSKKYYDKYDYLIFINFSYLEKKANFYFIEIPKYVEDVKRKHFNWMETNSEYVSFFNNMLNLTNFYKDDKFKNQSNYFLNIQSANIFNKIKGKLFSYNSIDLYKFYSNSTGVYNDIRDSVNTYYNFAVRNYKQDELCKYSIDSKIEIKNEVLIHTHDGRYIRGDLLNYNEIFILTKYDNYKLENGRRRFEPNFYGKDNPEYPKSFSRLSDEFILLKKNLRLLSTDGISYTFKSNEINFIINYDDLFLNIKSNEFIDNNTKHNNNEYIYKIGYLLNVKENVYINQKFPLKHTIEKRITNSNKVNVNIFDLTYFNFPSSFNQSYFWTTEDEFSDGHRNIYLDRILKFNIIQNGNLIVEIQDINEYYIFELDESHDKLNWSYSINRWASGWGCLDSPYLKLGYVYMGAECNLQNECSHELLQISGPPDYYRNRLEEKYPELVFDNFSMYRFSGRSQNSRSVKENKSKYPYDVGLFFSSENNIIYSISSRGEISGYYNAILESEIVKNQSSLYDISVKYGYDSYQARRVNRYFLKNKRLKSQSNQIKEYIDYNTYTANNYNRNVFTNNLFGINLDKELDLIGKTNNIYENIKKYKYEINLLDYQIENFLQKNYIYKDQIIYFYTKGAHYVPRNGKYTYVDEKGNVRFDLKLDNFSPTYPAELTINNYKNNNILEEIEDSLLILRHHKNGEIIQKYEYVIDKHENYCNCFQNYTDSGKCLGYRKIKESYVKDMIKINNKNRHEYGDLLLHKNSNKNFDSIKYYIEIKVNGDIVSKEYYYSNNKLAAIIEYDKSKPIKSSGFHDNGNIWYVDKKTEPKKEKKWKKYSSKYLRNSRQYILYEDNLLYPFTSYITLYENGDTCNILEFYDNKNYKEIKKDTLGNIIEYKDSVKYLLYNEKGVLIKDFNFNSVNDSILNCVNDYVIENGTKYNSNGVKSEEFIIITDPKHLYSDYKTLSRYRSYNNGFLHSDYRYSDIYKEITYHYQTEVVSKEKINYPINNNNNNQPCLSLKNYSKEGVLISNIKKEYIDTECVYVEYDKYYDDSSNKIEVDFKNNIYKEFDKDSNIVVFGCPNRMNCYPYDIDFKNRETYDKYEEYMLYFNDRDIVPYKTSYKYSTKTKLWKMKTYDKDNVILNFYSFADTSCINNGYNNENKFNLSNIEYCQYLSKKNGKFSKGYYLLEPDSNRYNQYIFKPILKSRNKHHILKKSQEYWIVENDTNLIEYDYFEPNENKLYEYSDRTAHDRYRKSLKTFKNSILNGLTIEYYSYNNNALHKNLKNKHYKMDPNNRIMSISNYYYGNLEGEYKNFYYNQNLRIQGYYSDNKKDGEWKYYYANGSIESINIFENGILKISKKYNMDGYEVCVTHYD